MQYNERFFFLLIKIYPKIDIILKLKWKYKFQLGINFLDL